MDIIDIIKGNDKRINPEYNPKTKKGASQPPYIINTDYNKKDDFASDILENVIPNQYGLSYLGDPTKYTDYNVTINPVNTKEELDKERANNQSVFEQGAYAIGQTLNEVTVGTVLGTADLASIVVDAIDGELSYERPDIIQSLSNLKDSINEQMPIYRENPNAAFDVLDFGWWASNIPSIASSLTLMVPGIGVSKGLSYLGKASRLNQLGNKVNNILKLSEKTRELAAKGIEATKTGVTMRMLENYQEATQVVDDAYQYAIDELNSMDDKKKKEFLNNNPQYINKSNDEIAKDIAKNAADKDFNINLWNTIFDIAQVYGLKNMWTKALQGSNTSSLRKLNKAAAAKFGDEAAVIQESIAKQTFKDKAIDKLKNIGEDIATGIRTEWTEGIEEAINYIGTEEGMQLAKLAFDKNTDTKTILDYLKDSYMWESAFWGVIGGVTFSTIGDKALNFAQRKFNKEWTNAEDKKKQEIYNRQLYFQHYQEAMSKIAAGKNPYITTFNSETNQSEDANIINDTEKEQLESVARNAYFDGMIVDAIDNGNYELLEEFAKDENIAKGFKEKLNLKQEEALDLQNKFIERLNTTKNVYLDVFNKVNSVGGNFDIGRIIARQVVKENNKKQLNETLKNYNDNLYNQVLSNDNINISNDDISAIQKLVYRNRIRDIENKIFNIKADASISKNRKNKLLNDLENQKKELEKLQPIDLYDENGIINDKEINNKAKKIKDNYNNEFNTIYAKFNNDINYELSKNSIDLSAPILRKRVNEIKNVLDESKRKIISNAIKTQNNLYRKYRNNFDVNNMSENDKAAYNTSLKVLQDNDYDVNNLALQRDFIDEEINRQNNYDETQTNNDNKVDDDASAQSSTGDMQQTNETPTNVNNLANTSTQTTSNISSPVEESQPQQPINTVPTSNTEQLVNNQPTIAPTTPTPEINPASMDISEQQDYIANYIQDIASDRIDFDNDNYLSQLDNIKNEIINDLKSKGFNENDINNEWYNFYAALGGDLSTFDDNGQLLSAIPESDRILLVNAGLAIMTPKRNLTKKQKHLKAILDDYAKMLGDNGISHGRKIGNKTYLSIDNLIRYIYNITNNKLIADYLFDDIKSFINSKINTEFVLTDDVSILNLNREQYKQRLKTFTEKEREQLEKYIPNNVNIDDVEFSIITNLNVNDEIDYKVDRSIGRIILYKDNNFIGYLGIPQLDSNGKFRTNNEGWIYDIELDNNLNSVSSLKEFIFKIFNLPDNNQLTIDLYNYTFNNDRTSDLGLKIYDELINNGANKFLSSLPIEVTEDEINIEKIKRVNHISKLLSRVAKDNNDIENSLNNWFNKLVNSYAQAYSVSNEDVTGKFIVNKLYKGNLNLDTENLQSITEVLPDYNEEKYPLCTIINNNTLQFANQSVPINMPGFSEKGVTGLIVPRENGTFNFVQCRQVKISDLPNNNFGKQLEIAAKQELKNIINRFIFDKNYSFEEFKNNVTSLVGYKGIIGGLTVNFNNKGIISFSINGEFILSIYNNDNINRKLKINNLKDSRFYLNGIYGADKNTINDTDLQKYLEESINNLFKDSFIGVPFNYINDSKQEPITTKYYKRENNKTIITIGNISKEFNSYQDFLISNNLITTVLNNYGKTSNPNVYGIYQKTDTTTVQVLFQPDATSWKTAMVDINSKVNPKLIENAFNTNKTNNALEQLFYNNQQALSYIRSLQNLNILPEVIYFDNEINDTENKPIYAYYDSNMNNIALNPNRLSSLSYNRLIRIIVHESLHEKLNNVYKRKDALDKIKPIYDKYKQYVENLTKTEPNNPDLPILQQFIDIVKDNEETSLEEFLVESLTNRDLMETLNKIPAGNYKTRIGKVESLFQKLLRIISDILGIDLNKDSLLYEELTLLKNIKFKPKKINSKKVKDVVSIQTTTQEENIISKTEEEIKENITTSEINNTTTEEISDEDDGIDYSSISERENTNTSNVIDNISPVLQPYISQMLSNGDISIYCM